jgi:hypothetical protein
MLQIQSTWFAIIDRNPQKFMPSTYQTAASDFVSVTQRIYCLPVHFHVQKITGNHASAVIRE